MAEELCRYVQMINFKESEMQCVVNFEQRIFEMSRLINSPSLNETR